MPKQVLLVGPQALAADSPNSDLADGAGALGRELVWRRAHDGRESTPLAVKPRGPQAVWVGGCGLVGFIEVLRF